MFEGMVTLVIKTHSSETHDTLRSSLLEYVRTITEPEEGEPTLFKDDFRVISETEEEL